MSVIDAIDRAVHDWSTSVDAMRWCPTGSPKTVVQIMEEICEWLRANGVEPHDVPIDAVPTIADGQLTVPVYLRNEQGRKYLVDDSLAMGEVMVPLVEPPPDVLADWLAGEVPPQ